MSDVTIYDVAKHAQVSITTVSRVLNTPDQVNPETRARVLAAIDALGFVPKAEATARARKSTRRIGVLAPFLTFPSFVERLRGVIAALSREGYELVVYDVESSAQRDSILASLPLTNRLDGLVVMALPLSESTAQRLLKHNLPAVLLECSHPQFSSIEIDDESGGRLAAELFVRQGRRRPAFVGDASVPDYAIPTSARRLGGYRRALAEAGVDLPDAYVALTSHTREEAAKATQRLLALPEPPDAIFAPSDTQAVGALKAARAAGVAVPQDLAIVGFDDVEFAELVELTTVRQHLEESGQAAVQLLLDRIEHPEAAPRRVLLSLSLIERATS